MKQLPLLAHLASLLCHHFSHYKLCYLVNVCSNTRGMEARVEVGGGGWREHIILHKALAQCKASMIGVKVFITQNE